MDEIKASDFSLLKKKRSSNGHINCHLRPVSWLAIEPGRAVEIIFRRADRKISTIKTFGASRCRRGPGAHLPDNDKNTNCDF